MSFDHGWQTCRACHAPGQNLRVEGEWHLRANPGYWGSNSPRVLVLGFSKGANQIAAAASGVFDAVAFARMRPRLQQVLDTLGIDLEGQTVDEALSAKGRVLGAASLIRCGLSLLKNGKLGTSGSIMPKAASNPFTRQVMATCVAKHLDPIPASVRTIILLGTTDAYVKGVKALMRSQFSDYMDINDVAFRAQGRVWVFAAHPSPANGEFGKWLGAAPLSASGQKRLLALQALRGVSVLEQKTTPVRSKKPTAVDMPTQYNRARRTTTPSFRLDGFATTFHLVRNDGRKVVPVMMKNRDTGLLAFRVARHGNTKDGTLEITDEAKLLAYCESGQYQVRVQPLDKSSPPSFVRPLLKHRLVRSPA